MIFHSRSISILLFVLAASAGARAQTLELAAYSKGGDLSGFLSGGELRGGPEQYSKVSLVFKEPQNLKRIELDSCEAELKDGVEFFFDPGFRRSFIEGGGKKLRIDVPPDAVKSFAIQFGRNQDFCVRNLRLVQKSAPKKGKAIELKAPRSVAATFKPSTGIAELFDSRPQTEPTQAKELSIEFAANQSFDRLRVWQGLGSEHATSLSVTADAGPAQTFEVATSTGVQELKLEKPVSPKKVVLKMKTGSLGELHFASGDEEVVPMVSVQDDSVLRAVASLGLSSVLDRELLARLDEKDAWIFRFRSDGTFFIRGYGDSISEARAFSVLGSFRVVKTTKKGAQLQLTGIRVPTATAWDGVLCPFECGETIGKRDQAVNDLIEIEDVKAGAVMIRNRTDLEKRTIPFSDLKSQNSAIEE